MASNQVYLFMVFTLVGMIIGFLFDFFRILRKTFKTKDLITYIEDIFFWLITGIIIICAMYNFSDGEFRFFMIIGIVIGTVIYMFTMSRIIVKIAINAINIIKIIIIYPVLTFYNLTKKYFFRPILVIYINLRKVFTNLFKKIKKTRGFFMKKEKYNSI